MRISQARFCAVGAAVLLVANQVAHAAEPNPAHALAEKFSAASSDDSDAAAKATAAKARAKAEKAKAVAQAARADAKKREQELSRQRQADELDMLARAKEEATRREAEQKRAEDDVARAEAAEVALEAEAVRRVEANRAAAGQREAAEAAAKVSAETAARELAEKAETEKRVALEAQREAETLKLAERLKEARRAKAAELDRQEAEARERSALATPPIAQPSSVLPPAIGPTPTVTTAPVAGPAAVPERAPQAIAALPTQPAQAIQSSRATVLLVLRPGTYGIRRWNQTQADPVLCLGDTCYLSQGADKPSKSMSRSVALGTGNTLGARAAACKGQLACVFRDVDFGPSGRADLQPVDLHILRHDRREVTQAAIDRSCAASRGQLTCSAAITAQTYRMQVIPEATAAAIEPSTFATSLANLGKSKLATSQ